MSEQVQRVEFFTPPERPTGGTVYLRPGNPYAHVDENEDMPQRYVDVHLPDALRVLDAYCRKGGSSAGYKRAGFHVTGVDIEDHSEGYAGDEFVQGDAIGFIKEYGHEFDLIHAGPPCQGQIAITQGNRARAGWTDGHVNLIPATREALEATGRPYVIENGPSTHLRPDVVLCGLAFDLPVFRHRYFELGNWTAAQPLHITHRGHLTIGWRHGCLRTVDPSLCPKHERWCKGTVYGVYGKGGGKPSVEEARRALGIDWMRDIDDLNEAIPPAYTEHLGRRFIAYRASLSAA